MAATPLSTKTRVALLPELLAWCVLALVVRGSTNGGSGDWTTADTNVTYKTIFVDWSGKQGNFTAIQAAIDSVPHNNRRWFCIYVMAGVYREKVNIPSDKPYIIIKGQNRRMTEVVWDDHENVAQSPTFTSMADNIVVKSISFRNSYNNPVNNSNPRVPAVAALISGDKSYFYRCGFYGLQDTLWDNQGRHYFESCSIQGAVDFIFGRGQSIYVNCTISVLGEALGAGISGIITAQGRDSPSDASGFLFVDCTVDGTGTTLLGRPWRAYARVIFYRSNLTSIVLPIGWNAWHYVGQESRLTFMESGCYGGGANTTGRVSWEKKMSGAAVEELISTSFIDSLGWLDNLPL
ncbi:hypothetical protein MLD38_039490 [Melastoma candidum]|uniref:Uncharacterized protein n=1 Tax=Melastoma candidum TaxID=119954 RepID=A0ACB9L3E7_9MYRT|nr:hypothetical protein MLD38_039490 [Melastoma candidum]